MTLLAAVFGGRVEYLRRRANWHQRQADRLLTLINDGTEWSPGEVERNIRSPVAPMWDLADADGDGRRFFSNYFLDCAYHRDMAGQYREAVRQPWTFVRDDYNRWMGMDESGYPAPLPRELWGGTP